MSITVFSRCVCVYLIGLSLTVAAADLHYAIIVFGLEQVENPKHVRSVEMHYKGVMKESAPNLEVLLSSFKKTAAKTERDFKNGSLLKVAATTKGRDDAIKFEISPPLEGRYLLRVQEKFYWIDKKQVTSVFDAFALPDSLKHLY